MKKSDSIVNLSAALSLAQAEMPVVPFDAKNPFFKSSYATLGSVIAASRPILAKHGLSICQFPVSSGVNSIDEEKGRDEKNNIIRHITITGSIGVETMLLHSSGEWISEALFVPLTEEKGNSLVQVIGKDVTYMKRYSWASVCGLYADEDTDGNGSGNMPTQPQAQRPATPARPAQAPKPTPAPPASTQRPILPRSGPVAKEVTRAWMLKELAGMEQDAWQYFTDNGSLMPEETLEKLPLEFVPTSREAMNALKEHIKAKFAAAEPPGLEEPPMDGNGNGNGNGAEDDCNSPDAPWRTYPLPFAGKKGEVAKGTELAKLDKDYLFGLVKNITVKTEYNGRPLTPEQIAKSEEFRHFLDDAGRHYKW